jgi:hypothetical protein
MRYGVNQKTVAKWKNRTSVDDVRTGPKEPKSTVLIADEERSSWPIAGTRSLRSTTACKRRSNDQS